MGRCPENSTQLIQGTIPLSQYSADVVGVRVVAQNQQVAAATTDTNGNFAIQVPVGEDYSFEIVTKSGTYSVLAGPINGDSPMLFDVCNPGEDFDLGDIDPIDFEEIDGDETPWTDSEEDCEVPPWICEDGTEDCLDEPYPCDDPAANSDFCWEEPLPCDDPAAVPEFCWDDECLDGGPNCEPIPVEPCDGPNADPANCGPIEPPCDDPEDCGPIPTEPCDGPNADPANCGPIEPPCEDPASNPEDCGPIPTEPCDGPNADPANCGPIDPPCEDPASNPEDCGPIPTEPCDGPNADPANCGGGEPPWEGECEDGYNDPTCWPEPDICVSPDGDLSECDEDVGGAPEFPFPDFGCDGDPAFPQE